MTTQQPQLVSDYLPSIGSSGVNMESEDVVERAFRSVDINDSGSVSKTVRNIATITPMTIIVYACPPCFVHVILDYQF